MFQVIRNGRVGRVGRLLVAVAGSVAAASALTSAPAAAHPGTAAPLPVAPPHDGDRLVVTVRNAGGGADGRFVLRCHPAGGDHPDAAGACAALDRGSRWGKDAFAPVPPGSVCTMQYGGPATAHVTGTWAGRPVDARFDRGDGCRIARWDRLVPVLPDLRTEGA